MIESSPSVAQMKSTLAELLQANKITHEIGVAMMRCLDGTPDKFNDVSLNKMHNLDTKPEDLTLIL